jgi:hypothetical protein
VNGMTKRDTLRCGKPQGQIMRRNELKKMLDILLTFDRSLVEVSMRIYQVPRRDRIAMRKQNRRLHHALRENLPRLLEPNPTFLPKAGRG